MRCIKCETELRPEAHFCSVCGALQPTDQAPTGEAGNARPDDSSETGSEGQGASRIKRPPRVPRITQTALADADSVVLDAGSPALPASAPDWEDAETAEYAVLPSYTAPEGSAQVLEPLKSMSGPAWDPGGFSWPLPLQIIKGGRYRVEQVLHLAEDPATDENVYRVRDLQGYERCWSCGAEYSTEHTSDTFCRQCGADLFGRPLRMYERNLPAEEVASDAAPVEAAAEPVAEPSADAAPEEHRFVEGRRAYRVVLDIPEPSPFPSGPRLLVGMAADVGKTRPGEQNEDSLGVFTLTLGVDSRTYPVALAVVADGMGGHASGQEASQLVVRTLADFLLRQLALPFLAGSVSGDEADDVLKGLLYEGARAANLALCKANDDHDADSGCTLVAALVVNGTAFIVNVGDSRAYVLADGALRRITTDHSLVEQLIAGGIITPEERYTHPQRNQIFNSLGDDPELRPDTFVQRLQPGMRLLLCSDGVWEMVRDDELMRLLSDVADPQQAAEALIAHANENGGEDNISAILLEARA